MTHPHYSTQTAEDALHMALALLHKWINSHDYGDNCVAPETETREFIGYVQGNDKDEYIVTDDDGE